MLTDEQIADYERRGMRLILASIELLDMLGTRTERGERITAEWGEPTPECWYEPTFTVHTDDSLGAALSAAEDREKELRAALTDAATHIISIGLPPGAETWRPEYDALLAQLDAALGESSDG